MPGEFLMDNPTILGYAKKPRWVEPFVESIGGRMASMEEIYANTTLPMAFSGITKSAAKTQALAHGLDWWYIDTGYLGNVKDKVWFRITRNNYQNCYKIQQRPADRLELLNIDRTQIKRGNQIAIVPPDVKVCSTFGIASPEQWIQDITALIKQHTDRPVVVRQRPASRLVRTTSDTFVDFLYHDINAVVVHSSNCGVEAAQHGIPVVSLADSGSSQISQPIEQIDNLPNLDSDRVEMWLRWLSYNQFSFREMRNYRAWKILQKNYESLS